MSRLRTAFLALVVATSVLGGAAVASADEQPPAASTYSFIWG